MQFAFGIIHGAGLLLLLIAHTALAQRWRSEFEDERPVDLESSGDDYFLEDEEMDGFYSASGSGYFERETRVDSGVRFTTETPVSPSSVTALKPAPTIHTHAPEESTWALPTTQVPVVHRHHPWEPPETPETTSVPASPAPTSPTKEAPTTSVVTTATARTTEVRRLQPVVVISTVATPTQHPTVEETMTLEMTDNQFSTNASQSGRLWPTEGETVVFTTSVDERVIETIGDVLPTQQTQTDSWEMTTVTARDSDFEIPVSGGPSGDFEIQEEDGVSQTEPPTIMDLGNEVFPPGTSPSRPGGGRKAGTGLIDNTVDSGNTLAQMPQKNILERREVLIAVIVGGVVGALFAAFLVMLLIYRMKKKDEGSYALEEPKPASVSYQKPDNHEEFYA